MFRRKNSLLIAQRVFRRSERNLSKTTQLSVQFQPVLVKLNVPQNSFKPAQRWYAVSTVGVPEYKIPPDVGYLDMRVGKVIEVEKAPGSESLLVMRIDVGNEIRVAGVNLQTPADKLLGRNVVVLCNAQSEEFGKYWFTGAIMFAENEEEKDLLVPPADAEPGDIVYCNGCVRKLNRRGGRSGVLLLQKLHPHLQTKSDLIVYFKKTRLEIANKGPVKVASLKDAFINVSHFENLLQ